MALKNNEVDSEESVIRLCYSPALWDDQKNEPTSAAFMDAFKKERGMSVYVRGKITEAELEKCRVELTLKKEGREKRPDLLAEVKEILSLRDIEKEQIFHVTLTPREAPGGKAHADILTIKKYLKKDERIYRSRLRDCFLPG